MSKMEPDEGGPAEEAFIREVIAAAQRYEGDQVVLVSVTGWRNGRTFCRAIEGVPGHVRTRNVYLDDSAGRPASPYAIEAREVRVGAKGPRVYLHSQFSTEATAEEVTVAALAKKAKEAEAEARDEESLAEMVAEAVSEHAPVGAQGEVAGGEA